MDGSKLTMDIDYIHGESCIVRSHTISGRVKALWSQFQANIPDGWRVCGEDLVNTHSIHYNNLASFLYGYAIWTGENICLSWDETIEYFQLLNISPVEVVYDRSEEHTSELQSLMRISYAVFCLKKKKKTK